MQGAALYVGDERVSETTIDGYVDDEVQSFFDQGATEADIDYASNRESAVLCVMFSELGRQMGLNEPDTSDAVSELDAECIRANAYVSEIGATAEPRELTDDELAHMVRLGAAFDQIPAEDQARLEATAGFSDTLADRLEEYDVRVNPRYGVETFELLPEEAEGLFAVEIPQR